MEFGSSEKHEIYAWCFVSQIKQEVVSIDGELDNKIAASHLEDADVFQVMSDITKNESTLKATLENSGKLMNNSKKFLDASLKTGMCGLLP